MVSKQGRDHYTLFRRKMLDAFASMFNGVYYEDLNVLVPEVPPVTFPCPQASKGCKSFGFNAREELIEHAEKCSFRTVGCPSHHRKACGWTGAYHQELFKHVYKNEKCVQTIQRLIPGRSFRSNMLDFPDPGSNVYFKLTPTNWLPMLLGFKVDGVYEVMYVTVMRLGTGVWYLIPRSYSAPQLLRRLKVSLQVHDPATPGEEAKAREQAPLGLTPHDLGEKSPLFRYEGSVNRAGQSDQEVMNGGKYLRFEDSHVKPIRNLRLLFEYSVQVHVEAKEESMKVVPFAGPPPPSSPQERRETTG